MKKRCEKSIINYYGALAIYLDTNNVCYLGVENYCGTNLKVIPASLAESLFEKLNFGVWEDTGEEILYIITPKQEEKQAEELKQWYLNNNKDYKNDKFNSTK